MDVFIPKPLLRMNLRILVLLLQIFSIRSASDTNRIKSLNVKCGDQDMLVDIEFNTPFNGIIFSKGYFARSECIYVKAAPSKYSYEFTIAYSGCGTTAGGSGLPDGARRSDGFLRSSDEVLPESSNSSRSRRDVSNSTQGPQGRALGGGFGGDMGAGMMGDPYAPNMQNQDLSAGGGAGYGDPMGGMGGGGGAGGGMGNQYWQPGPDGGNAAYSQGMPIYNNMQGGGQAGGYGGAQPGMGGYGGGGGYQQPQQNMGYQQGNPGYQQPNPGYQGNAGGVMWNGNSGNSGPVNMNGGQSNFQGGSVGQGSVQDGNNRPIFSSGGGNGAIQISNNGNKNTASSSAQNSGSNVQVKSSASSQSGQAGFASSIPGGQSKQSEAPADAVDDDAQSETGLKTNLPYEDRTGGTSRFFENIIIIQYDANIQEVWDVAKALRCEWHDNYHKTVSYKPFQVDSLEVVPATFAGDNVGVWMTVQQGKGPYAPEVNGIVRIGEYLTLAIGIQDKTKKFDMRVINCFASDGVRPAVQLIDEFGCVVRPKIMSDVSKVTNYGDQASVVAYAYFQAFKFPDSVDVHLECSVEICKFGCAKQCYNKISGDGGASGISKSGNTVASISSGLSFGGSSAAARGQMARKSDGVQADSAASSTGEKASVSKSVSAKSATGANSLSNSGSSSAAVASNAKGKSSSASSGGSSSGQDAGIDVDENEKSVNSNVRKSMEGGKLIKIGKKDSGQSSSGSKGAGEKTLYNAMAADDYDNDSDSTRTKATTKSKAKNASNSGSSADEDERAYRKRRDAPVNPDLQKNVGMRRTIRVVAPGDLSFFDNNRNGTVVYSAQRIVGSADVCISPTSFVAGIVVLVALLLLTTLTSLILCLRLRSLDRVSNKLKEIDLEYIKNTM